MRAVVILIGIFWLSRVVGLEALPLHNDEGLHLTRAVEVWNFHPFWEIRDGKIINHWAIALFYPQNAPVFAGRIATVFVCALGLAAGCALARRAFGRRASWLAGALWIASPYLFFFERLAFSDAEAGALVVLALWAGWRLAERGTLRRALLTGFAFGLAVLFKFTAAPFALGVALVVLLRARYSLRRRLGLLLVAGIMVGLMFVPPTAYLMLRGSDLFSIALGWIGGGSRGESSIPANGRMLAAQLTDFGVPLWSGLMLAGLALLVGLRPRKGGVLLLAAAAPLLIIMLLGREVLSRHYVVAMPALLTLGGAGLGVALERLAQGESQRRWAVALMTGALGFGFAPFALTAYRMPEQLPLSRDVWTQHISEHSAGYGLREAVEALPETTAGAPNQIIASMTADSCRRANFYAAAGWGLYCADARGLGDLASAI